MLTLVERIFRDFCAKFILRFNFMVHQSMNFVDGTCEQTRCQNRPKKITAKDQEGFKFLHSMILGGATVAQVDAHVVGISTQIIACLYCST